METTATLYPLAPSGLPFERSPAFLAALHFVQQGGLERTSTFGARRRPFEHGSVSAPGEVHKALPFRVPEFEPQAAVDGP